MKYRCLHIAPQSPRPSMAAPPRGGSTWLALAAALLCGSGHLEAGGVSSYKNHTHGLKLDLSAKAELLYLLL